MTSQASLIRSLRYSQRLVDVSGGLNWSRPADQIEDNELAECLNFWYPDGYMVKRPGFNKFSTANLTGITDPTGVVSFFLKQPGGIGQYLLLADYIDKKLWTMSSSGVPTVITGTINDGPTWAVNAGGTAYIGFAGANSMGIRTLLTASTISAANITNAPTASYCGVFHKGRLFAGAVNSVNNRLAFSDPNAPGTWQTTSTLDVGDRWTDSIVALVSTGDLLYIIMQYSVWTLYIQGTSSADWVLRKIADFGGCWSPGGASAVSYDGNVYFISNLGVYKTNGTSFVRLSDKIWQPEFLKFSIPVGLGANTGQNCRLVRINDILLVVVRNYQVVSSVTSIIGYTFAYNLLTGAWSRWDFNGFGYGFDDVFVVEDMFVDNNTPKKAAILGSNNQTGGNANIYVAPSLLYYDYDGTITKGYANPFADAFSSYLSAGTGNAIGSVFQTKLYTSFVDRYMRAKYASLEYLSRSPGPTFSWLIDDGISSSYTPGFNASYRRVYKMPGAGRHRQLGLRCDHALTLPFEFYKAMMHVSTKVTLAASGTP